MNQVQVAVAKPRPSRCQGCSVPISAHGAGGRNTGGCAANSRPPYPRPLLYSAVSARVLEVLLPSDGWNDRNKQVDGDRQSHWLFQLPVVLGIGMSAPEKPNDNPTIGVEEPRPETALYLVEANRIPACSSVTADCNSAGRAASMAVSRVQSPPMSCWVLVRGSGQTGDRAGRRPAEHRLPKGSSKAATQERPGLTDFGIPLAIGNVGIDMTNTHGGIVEKVPLRCGRCGCPEYCYAWLPKKSISKMPSVCRPYSVLGIVISKPSRLLRTLMMVW